jgi:dCMP deaminase
MLINCQFTKIYFAHGYPDELAVEMLYEAGVEFGLLQLENKEFVAAHGGP